MSEYENHNLVDPSTQETEPSVDVTSLKQLNMTRADYDRYVDLEQDDPEFADLFGQYDVTPGEPVIVSAIDAEHPENNVLRVIATGDDLFTTNRRLTNQLEAELQAQTGDIIEVAPERAELAPSEDTKKLGGLALEATGVIFEQEATTEQGLLEARARFDTRLNQLSTEHTEAVTRLKNGIKVSAEDISAMRNRLEQSAEDALRYLRSGINQPDRIRQGVNLAIEELTGVNGALDSVLQAAEGSSAASGSLHAQAETHGSDVSRLREAFRADVGKVADEAPELDRATLGRADAEVAEMTAAQTAGVNRLEAAVLDIDVALRQIGEDADTAQQRTRNLLGRLEEARVHVGHGRLSSSDYEDVVRSAGALVRELQESTAIRRFATLAEEL
jgi:hypothetical protein